MGLFSRKKVDVGPPVPFTFVISDVFNIPLKGLVVTGVLIEGRVQRGQQATVDLPSGRRQVTVKSIERNHKMVDVADGDEQTGLLLDGLHESDIPLSLRRGGAVVDHSALNQLVVRG